MYGSDAMAKKKKKKVIRLSPCFLTSFAPIGFSLHITNKRYPLCPGRSVKKKKGGQARFDPSTGIV